MLYSDFTIQYQAINMIGELKHDNLTNQLLDYFMGEMDQSGLKGPQYIFSLHIVLGNYDQATKAASQIATQEQVTSYQKTITIYLYLCNPNLLS